jgi:hypothetical protein
LQRPKARSDQELDAERSAEACPACGRHTVSLLGFPYVATMGAQPTADILGMGELSADQPPAIACLFERRRVRAATRPEAISYGSTPRGLTHRGNEDRPPDRATGATSA